MKAGFSLPRFIELSLIGSMILLIAPIASTTAVVKQRKPDTGACSLPDSQRPSIYLIRDTTWDDPKTIRMILRNNSSCSIALTIFSKLTMVRPGIKIPHPPVPMVEDGASVVLKYMVSSVTEPFSFIEYLPYDHTVSTPLTLNGGHSIKFLAQAEHLRQRRQIAVPFNYIKSGAFISCSLAERLVYFSLD
jgi:hypothetical protein